MGRLIKESKPRPKKDQVILSVKLYFEAYGDNDEDTKGACIKFKDWVRDQFTEWDQSILEYFLYSYGLVQDPDDERYILNVRLDKIIKDESVSKEEQEKFMEEIDEIEEQKLKDLGIEE